MATTHLEHKGRSIRIDLPEGMAPPADDRCEECRKKNVAVCTHHDHADHDHVDHAHPEPEPTTPMQQMPMPGQGPAMDPAHAGHGVPFKVMIDGRSFDAFVMLSGSFYSHELPFMMYSNPGDLARAIANKLDWMEPPDGGPEKPETPQRS